MSPTNKDTVQNLLELDGKRVSTTRLKQLFPHLAEWAIDIRTNRWYFHHLVFSSDSPAYVLVGLFDVEANEAEDNERSERSVRDMCFALPPFWDMRVFSFDPVSAKETFVEP